MAIFVSDLMKDGALPTQNCKEGDIASVTAVITIPSGTPVASGDIFRFARFDKNARIVNVRVESSDFDTGATATATAGLQAARPVTNPRKAFNSTTNPYIAGGLTAAVSEAFLTGANAATALQAGGLFNSNLPTIANQASIDGTFDAALVLTASPTGNPSTDRTIRVTFEYLGATRTPGEFNAQNAYIYTDETSAVANP